MVSSLTMQNAPTLTVRVGVPIPPVPGSVTSASVPSSQETWAV